MKPGKVGLARVLYASLYSYRGVKAAWENEAAFRQEVVLILILLPILIFSPLSATERALMILSVLIVLIVELLNSAVETVVDRIGSDFHPLSGRAKDLGSAAVFVALSQAVVIWTLFLWPLLVDVVQ